nr:SEC-C metal-binding domain-containing protein [Olivibacter sp. XZL3]
MKFQRNDPCSCGSGLKYKKCCMNKTNVEGGSVTFTISSVLKTVKLCLENVHLFNVGVAKVELKEIKV